MNSLKNEVVMTLPKEEVEKMIEELKPRNILLGLGFIEGYFKNDTKKPVYDYFNGNSCLTILPDGSYQTWNKKTRRTYDKSMMSGKFKSLIKELQRLEVIPCEL